MDKDITLSYQHIYRTMSLLEMMDWSSKRIPARKKESDTMEGKVLVEYVRRPVYGQVSKRVIDEVKHLLTGEFTDVKTDVPVAEVDPWRVKEIENLFKSTINNQKVGVMLACVVDGKVVVSYSQWNQWEDDEYDYYTMMDVAIDRGARFAEKIEKNPDFTPRVPYLIAEKLPRFLERCRRYFKDAEMPKWTEAY